jgi:exodeoxyribonuclease III
LLISTVNIQATGLVRAGAIITWLDRRSDHVVILTETTSGPGTSHILERCRTAGWSVAHNPLGSGDRGSAILSRLPIEHLPDLTEQVSLPGRAVACRVASNPPLTILGLYAPSSDREPAKVAKKREFLRTVLEMLSGMPEADRRGLVVGGDYNVIARTHQPAYPAFLAFEYEFLDALTGEIALVDPHDHLHPQQQPHSWLGRGGNGYRFDYLHVSSELAEWIVSSEYLHQPRLEGLTDHAAVALGLDVEIAHLRLAGESLVSTGALF